MANKPGPQPMGLERRNVLMTPKQHTECVTEANRDGVSFSFWMREAASVALTAAKDRRRKERERR